MRLSDELEKWRCDRPDEWKMDEFIRKAREIEAALSEANEESKLYPGHEGRWPDLLPKQDDKK